MNKSKHIIGYTAGVYDLFHIGHLNILRLAKQLCDELIVGVTTDEVVRVTKHKTPVIPFNERCEIVKSIIYVDKVVPQTDLDKIKAHDTYQYDLLFVGDDWKGDSRWIGYEDQLRSRGVEVIYFPYTKTTSSTLMRAVLKKILKD
jgi:glycerol-3-phosphate cytidylyltransferase